MVLSCKKIITKVASNLRGKLKWNYGIEKPVSCDKGNQTLSKLVLFGKSSYPNNRAEQLKSNWSIINSGRWGNINWSWRLTLVANHKDVYLTQCYYRIHWAFCTEVDNVFKQPPHCQESFIFFFCQITCLACFYDIREINNFFCHIYLILQITIKCIEVTLTLSLFNKNE